MPVVELNSTASQRITMPPEGKQADVIKAPAETVMKHLVRRNLVEATEPGRNIADLIIAPDKGRGPVVEVTTRYRNLEDELNELLMRSGLSWSFYEYREGTVFEVKSIREEA
ncbi:hypothetical protein HUG15_05805 [Salicibibacter cibarius]|uniref:Gp28/Gp37-like domain-containing protein n=1 Tax=Salicibibacter cibarius TaxID=2743000 RepID=A0A7T7CAX2_9BACI|nr:hypothetical protein [Salicibibacter cibarius]QQK75109.1 hypothetical protein HUG15_05475 [Salicibibacter cibarius]QQK75169.1 hypothetical protein HUG15_05805 [Salicibibacter cibarius]